jgi:hypothetical protein
MFGFQFPGQSLIIACTRIQFRIASFGSIELDAASGNDGHSATYEEIKSGFHHPNTRRRSSIFAYGPSL